MRVRPVQALIATFVETSVSANTGGGRSGTVKAEADRTAAKTKRKACRGIRVLEIFIFMAFALLMVALPRTSPLTKHGF
jgi:hypothetical protein